MEKIYSIYGLSCPKTGCVKYIGATSTRLAVRMNAHNQSTKVLSHKTKKDEWFRALRAEGLVPKIFLIEETTSELWQERETYWISKYRADGFELLNQTLGGFGAKGYNHTEKRKREIGEFFKGNQYRVGKKRVTYVWKDGIPYKPTAEVNEKRGRGIRAAYESGKVKPSERSKGLSTHVVQYTVNMEYVAEFCSATEASRQTNIPRKSIAENIRGVNKTAYGYVFKFKFPKIAQPLTDI